LTRGKKEGFAEKKDTFAQSHPRRKKGAITQVFSEKKAGAQLKKITDWKKEPRKKKKAFFPTVDIEKKKGTDHQVWYAGSRKKERGHHHDSSLKKNKVWEREKAELGLWGGKIEDELHGQKENGNLDSTKKGDKRGKKGLFSQARDVCPRSSRRGEITPHRCLGGLQKEQDQVVARQITLN